MSPEASPNPLDQRGPRRAPRSFPRRVFRALVALIFVVAALWALITLLGSLPRGTTAPALAVRAAVGLGIGVLLILVVRRMLRALTEPPPPPPPTVDARLTDVVYECPVCGTRVRLELAATAKPPKHCGEEMEPKISAAPDR